MFQILQSAVNHWVGTVRMSSRRYFGQEVARPVGGQSLGFRGEFCAGDRPWSRPKCRRFGAVGLSQSRSIGARRRAPKIQPRPFSFFLWKGKFWGDKITLYHFPELAAGAASFQHQDPGERRIGLAFSIKLPKGGSFGEEKLFALLSGRFLPANRADSTVVKPRTPISPRIQRMITAFTHVKF